MCLSLLPSFANLCLFLRCLPRTFPLLTKLLYENCVHKSHFESGGRASTSSTHSFHAVRHGYSAGVKRQAWKRAAAATRPGKRERKGTPVPGTAPVRAGRWRVRGAGQADPSCFARERPKP